MEPATTSTVAQIVLPKKEPFGARSRQKPVRVPSVVGAIMGTLRSTVAPGRVAGMGRTVVLAIEVPWKKTSSYPLPHVQVPELRSLQVLVKDWPGVTRVRSGIVTSVTKVERSQAVALVLLVPPVVVGLVVGEEPAACVGWDVGALEAPVVGTGVPTASVGPAPVVGADVAAGATVGAAAGVLGSVTVFGALVGEVGVPHPTTKSAKAIITPKAVSVW